MGHIIEQLRAYVTRVRDFSRNARLVLLALALIGISYGAFSTLFNLYIIELGYDEAFLGQLIAVGSAAGALVAVPSGLLCDRIGTRRGLLLGTVITAVGILIETTITISWVLLVGAVIAALGVALIFVAQAPFFAANSSEHERTHLFSVAAAILVAASIIGSLFAGYFPDVMQTIWSDLSLAGAYRATLLASGAISAFSLYALLQLRESGEREYVPASRDVIAACFHSSAVRRLVLTGLFLSLGGGLVVPFFNVYFQQVLGASTSTIGVIHAISIVVTVIGSLGAPWLGGRIGLVWAVIIARLLSAPFLLLMGVSPLLSLAVLAYAVRTFLVYMSDPLHTDFSMRIVPREIRATANSLTFMSWNLTLAAGSVIGGRMIAQVGYELPFLAGSLITVIAAGVYWLAFRGYVAEARRVEAPVPAQVVPQED